MLAHGFLFYLMTVFVKVSKTLWLLLMGFQAEMKMKVLIENVTLKQSSNREQGIGE